jgi:hypothetical protein
MSGAGFGALEQPAMAAATPKIKVSFIRANRTQGRNPNCVSIHNIPLQFHQNILPHV